MRMPSNFALSRRFPLATVFVCSALLAGQALAVEVDLTGNNNVGSANGAVFTFTDQQPTGTGVIKPFLREQSDPNEQGYNTSGGTPFDAKAGPWTHDLTFSDLAASEVMMNGVLYFKLLLDANEPGGSKSLISLDRLEFYTSSTGSQTTTTISSLGTLRYSLDSNGDNFVMIDASRNHGSGSGDMYAYIPVAGFAGVASTDYVYMFARFGDQAAADGTSAGGFEEWSIVEAVSPVPEPSVFALVGLAMVALPFVRSKMRRDA